MVDRRSSELDQLAVELFKKFARIEYSLKAAGFHRGEGPAWPNWDTFASSVRGVLENDPAIAMAITGITVSLSLFSLTSAQPACFRLIEHNHHSFLTVPRH